MPSIGKTLIDAEYNVSTARKNAMLADYPSPPYEVQVYPLGGGRYNVLVFV
jgi:hypothetical protein